MIYQIVLDSSAQGEEMGRARSTYGVEDKCIHDSDGEKSSKKATLKI